MNAMNRAACLMLACASLYAFAGDEALDPRAAAFFEVSTAVTPVNVFVGLTGLQAPRNRDFLDFGRERAAARVIPSEERDKDLIPIKYDADRMNCWIVDWEPFEKEPQCAPLVEAVQTLRDNETVLARYRFVRTLPAGGEGDAYYSGRLAIMLAKLSAISVKVAWREGRAEDAYSEWAGQMRLANQLCGGTTSLVELAICEVVEGLSLGTGEMLFFRMPEVIDRHADDALALLRFQGLQRYDLPGMQRRWYLRLKRYYEGSMPAGSILPHYVENRFFQYSQQLLAAATIPMAQLKSRVPCECLATEDEGSSDAQLAASAKLVDQAFGTVYTELLQSAHRKNRQRALLATRIILGRDHVAPASIPERLETMVPEVSDPLSYAPMEWDASKRILHYSGEAAAPYLEARF